MRIAWIGLGKMGRPMSGHLVAAGHDVMVDDASPEAVAASVAAGARPLETIADAEVAFSMIPDDAALGAVAPRVVDGLRPGAVYVDMSTVSPEACDRVRGAAEARGVLYLAAPVSGSTATAAARALTVFASGPEPAFATARPLLETMARRVFHLGRGAEARFMKLAVNHLIGSTAQLVAEALTLGRKGGVAWDDLLSVLGESAAASPLIGYKLDPLRRRDFSPAFTVRQMVKDMSLVSAAGDAVGVPMPLAEAVRRRFEEQDALGLAGEDFFAAVKDVERRAGLGEP